MKLDKSTRLPTEILSTLCLLATLLMGGCSSVPITGPEFNVDGFRKDGIHTPTADHVPGGETLNAEGVKHLIDQGKPLGLIDVVPTPPRPPELPAGTLWLPPRHTNIPGSLWIPDAGQPGLSDALERYFRWGLEKVTNGDKTIPVVIYCRENCWSSWNAAMRAARWGYKVIWYPGGVEEWGRSQFPLVPAQPAPWKELGR